MKCLMCFSSDGKLHMFQGDMDNESVKRIKFILPDFLIPESKEPVFICSTCLNQVSFFHTIKKASLQNCSRLKHFNAVLKGMNNLKCNELDVILNSDEISVQRKHYIEFKVNPKNTYLLSSNDHDVTHIKDEDDHYSQQLVNDELSLHHLQDDESSCGSDDSTQHHVNLGSFEFVDTNKFTEEDSNLTSSDSRYQGQSKTQGGSQKKRYKCTDCPKAFTLRKDLKRHTRVHTGEIPFKCTTCQKTFTRLSSLKTHKLTHTGEKPHECDVCLKTFSRKSSLIEHKRIHNNVRPHKCAVCSKGFTTSSHLNTHMFTHTGEKPHQCHHCEYKCTTASHLKTHIRHHTGEKPYSCKHCEKPFTTSCNIKEHIRRHHSNTTVKLAPDSQHPFQN